MLLYGEILEPGHCSRNEDYQRSRWGELVVWDYRNETAPVQLTGQTDVRNALNGGWGADSLNGSELADTLRGGPSADTLRGNDGADRFQFFPGHGDDTVLDFTESEGDILDLSPIFADRRGSPSQFLTLSIQVTRDTNNIPRADTVIDVDEDGNGTPDQRITLLGVAYGAGDLPRLTGEGVIQLGGPQFDTSVQLAASEAALIETEVARTLTITRSGNLDAAMDVQLSFVGSADVGVDYQLTNAAGVGVVRTVSFGRGESTATIDLTPIQDALPESETIQIAVLAMPEVTGLPGTPLVLSLGDAPAITIEALVDTAQRLGPVPGIVQVTREAPFDTPLTVDLVFTNEAINGREYELISPSIIFTPGVQSVQLDITPSSFSPIQDRPVQADFAIVPDKTQFAVAAPGAASVLIVDAIGRSRRSYATWSATNFPGQPTDGAFDANPDGDLLANGFEYAYGTDPNTGGPLRGTLSIHPPSGFIELRMAAVSGLTDVQFALEGTTNLLAPQWHDVTTDFEVSGLAWLDDDRIQRTYRSRLPVEDLDPRMFYRLRVREWTP